jgi:hypothetical protein
MDEQPVLFGFSTKSDANTESPIEYTEHVIVGNNPDTMYGYWDTEHEAAWALAKHMEEVLKDAEGKLLFVRRAPKLERHRLFDRDQTVYTMIGRFSIGGLKEKNHG